LGWVKTPTATQLPELTMVTEYARWDSALLIPTRRAEHLYAGWWQLIEVRSRSASDRRRQAGGKKLANQARIRR
jgi:hypothetical protein